MLIQKCNPTAPARPGGQAQPEFLRDGHIVLLAIDAVLAVRAAAGRWLERRRTRQALAELDDRQLRDIGVTRTGVRRDSRRWWRSRDAGRRALAALDDSQIGDLSDIGRQRRREARHARAHP